MEPLVQPIIVVEHEPHTHLEIVRDVASASLGCYLSQKGNEEDWSMWLTQQDYRKTVRRLRRSMYDRLLEETPEHYSYGAATAFPPRLYADFSKLMRRAQVRGVEFPRNETEQPQAENLIVLNDNLGMSTGKAAAQAAHALWMLWDVVGGKTIPEFSLMPVSERFRHFEYSAIAEVIDKGFTEVAPLTVTALVLKGDVS